MLTHIKAPFISVPGDDSQHTMAKRPHLHSQTSSYALWVFGWPYSSPRATQFGCYHIKDHTWVIADFDGRVLYTAEGSPPDVFRSDDTMFAWLSGLEREASLNDKVARAVRKAHMRVVA